ncbi:hypothetical protein MESS4_340039 [Mesorhizobium sp. STM 4661]|nr:hypothetical protein MESS4_340039 [Mesorhizobium sp. STM 4661]
MHAINAGEGAGHDMRSPLKAEAYAPVHITRIGLRFSSSMAWMMAIPTINFTELTGFH